MGPVQTDQTVKPLPLTPQPGSPLAPAAVVGRDRTIQTALEQLQAGNNLLINDPRRMGKTALLSRLCNRPGPSTLAVLIDYEGVTSTADFLYRTVASLKVHQEIWKRAADAVRTFFDELELERGPIRVKMTCAHRDPAALLIDIIRGVNARLETGEQLIVAMDEVPLAIDNILANQGPAQAGQTLQAMRRLRQSHPSNIRWIVTGSVGFHHVLRRAKVTEGLMNDLVNLPLGPLTPANAGFLARCLLLGIGREAGPGGVEALVRRSGAIPFLLHQLAHLLCDGTGPVAAREVEEVFDRFVADRDLSRAVTHLLTRLEPNFGTQAADARRILDATAVGGPLGEADLAAAVTGEASGDRDRLLELLEDLCDDHYLLRRVDAWSWRYDVLREIWCRRRHLQ